MSKVRNVWKKKRVEKIVREFEERRRCPVCGNNMAFERVNRVTCSDRCRQAKYREARYEFLRDRRLNRNNSTH